MPPQIQLRLSSPVTPSLHYSIAHTADPATANEETRLHFAHSVWNVFVYGDRRASEPACRVS
jgi:hypothetical protein